LSWKIITHGDSDGLCAGAIASMVFEGDIWFSNPYKLIKDLKSTKSGTNIAVCDLAINQDSVEEVMRELYRLGKHGEVCYFDHHPLPSFKIESYYSDIYLPLINFMGGGEGISASNGRIRFYHDKGRSASEIVHSLYRDRLPRETAKIALYGAIGDYTDETKWVKNELERWDKRIIYFQAGILLEALGEVKKEYELKREIASRLISGTEPSEMDEVVGLARQEALNDKRLYNYVKNNASLLGEVACVMLSKGSMSKGAHFAMGLFDAKVGLCAMEKKSRIDISLRCKKSEPIDLTAIVSRIVGRLGGSGGGHKAAAGASIPGDKFDRFIELLNRYIE